nr:MAG TPA: Chromatin remodeling complex ATPase [Caudoviricetes sp.]
MTVFKFGGPERFAHQKAGLKKIIQNKGTAALLFEPGLGKGHPLSDKVLTPLGWRRVGDLKIGSAVIGSKGRAIEVTGVYDRGVLDVYRVTMHDGGTVVVDGDHLWKVGRKQRDGMILWTVKDTRTLMAEARDDDGRMMVQYCIPVVENIRSAIPTESLPIEPYLLGHMLSRGSDEAQSIPEKMLVASLGARRGMLAALVETSDLETRRGAVFVTRYREAAEGVRRLAWSLGLAVQLFDRSWDGHPQFRVVMHKDRHPLRWIESIVPAGREHVRCISVDAKDRLYVANDWIVTHNTATVVDYASLLAIQEEVARVLVVAPLAAVDQWALQAPRWASPQVNVWAEALGGSVTQKLEALQARGGLVPAKPTGGAGPGKAFTGRNMHGHRSIAVGARKDGEEIPPDEVWPSGLNHFLDSEKPLLVIEALNIDVLSQRRAEGSRTTADRTLDAIRKFGPDLVVIDESHLIKSVSSNVSRLAARIGRQSKRRIILTGTVMPKNPLDVFAQWRFLDPKAFGRNGKDATFTEFKNEYAVMGGFMGYEVKGFRNLDHMQKIMGQRAAVALKAEALDLPKTTDVVVPVHLSTAEERAYEAMKKRLQAVLLSGRSSTAMGRLAQMMRLRQITAGHLPDDDGNVEVIGKSKAKTVASIVNDTLDGEDRIVVFAVFRREIEQIRQEIARKDTVVLTITGDTDPEERLAMRRRFGSKDPQRIVLVAQIQTLSLAVNELVTASNAVFASLSTKRDEWVQARDRLNRLGQTRPCTFWYALAPGTVDEVQYKVYEDRSNLERSVLTHVLDGNPELVGKVVSADGSEEVDEG